MKYSISIALVLLAFAGMTQSRHPSLSILPTEVLRLKKKAAPLIPPSFSHFEIIDQRQDTGRLGIHNENLTLGKAENVQMVLNKGTAVAADLAAWLNEHFARPGAPYRAYIVLRGLWLCDANYLRQERIANPAILFERTHIRLKAEIYAVRDDGSFTPILRYDSLQTYRRYNPYASWTSYYSHWETDLTGMLQNMIDSASGLTVTRAEKGRRLKLDDIRQYNRSRFDAPVVDSATLTPGVYVNFEEFRKNTPSISNFEVRMEKTDHILYIKDDAGTLQYTHDVWGYCDGKNIFILRDGILLPIWKEGNAFYFQGLSYRGEVSELPAPTAKQVSDDNYREANWPKPDAPPALTSTSFMQRRIYTIDMDSGKIY